MDWNQGEWSQDVFGIWLEGRRTQITKRHGRKKKGIDSRDFPQQIGERLEMEGEEMAVTSKH
jgi:hypothetical protein